MSVFAYVIYAYNSYFFDFIPVKECYCKVFFFGFTSPISQPLHWEGLYYDKKKEFIKAFLK